MLSMKGLRLKVDIDCNNCLLLQIWNWVPKILKKLGKFFYFCPYSGICLNLLFLVFLYLSTTVFHPLLFAISWVPWFLVSSMIEFWIVFKLSYLCCFLHYQVSHTCIDCSHIFRTGQDSGRGWWIIRTWTLPWATVNRDIGLQTSSQRTRPLNHKFKPAQR